MTTYNVIVLACIFTGLLIGVTWLEDLWRERPEKVRQFCGQVGAAVALLAWGLCVLALVPIVIAIWLGACLLEALRARFAGHQSSNPPIQQSNP
jgi:hypothetical protein